MNLPLGEEKKDKVGGTDEQGDRDDSEDDGSDGSDEFGDLPPELTKLIGEDRVFESEEGLKILLRKLALAISALCWWTEDLALSCRRINKTLLPVSTPPSSQTSATPYGVNGDSVVAHTKSIFFWSFLSREPDLSYWGYPRCSKKRSGSLTPTDDGSIPDVIVQFSWKNQKKYEKEAINDMMTKGLEHDNGALSTYRPTLGYLIKVRF